MAGLTNIKIGPVRLTVDPDSISVVDHKRTTMIPGMRSNNPRVINTGRSRIHIRMSTVFPDAQDVNDKLRHIIAYFRATPFLNIKSDVINKMIANRIVQRIKETKITKPLGDVRAMANESFVSDMSNLITETLIDPLVNAYLLYRGTTTAYRVKAYLEQDPDFNKNMDNVIDNSLVASLASKYVGLNYWVADPTIAISGSTQLDQIENLRAELRQRMIDGSADIEQPSILDEPESAGTFALSSKADVLDGDTIRVGAKFYRVYGVDTFESFRPGTVAGPAQGREGGIERSYASQAKLALTDLLFDGNTPRPFQIKKLGTTYERELAVITVVSPAAGADPDVAVELVRSGLAIPSGLSDLGYYANAGDFPYIEAAIGVSGAKNPRTGVRSSKVGLWNGVDVQMPSLWRGLARDINNFEDPLSPDFLRDELIPKTLISTDALRLALETLYQQLSSLRIGPTDVFRSRAQALVERHRSTIQSVESADETKKQLIADFKGFPGDLVPVCFVGISYSGVHSLPDAVQAEFSFSLFNHMPFGTRLQFISSKSVNDEGKLTVSYDPDMSYSVELDRYVHKNFIGEQAVGSQEYLERYSPLEDISIDYQEITRVKGAPRVDPGDIRDARLAQPEQWQRSKELLDRQTRLVFKPKKVILSTDQSATTIENSAERDADIIKINNLQIDTVSCNITNNIVSIPIEGATVPTAQHLGKGLSRVSIELNTTDEDAIMAFRTIDQSIQEAAEVANRYGIPTSFRMHNPMINMGGIKDLVFENIIINTDPDIPGKYNIRLMLIESVSTDQQPSERLIPRFEANFNDLNASYKRVIEVVRANPDHPLAVDFLDTFMPVVDIERAYKFPLALIFAHTKYDDPGKDGEDSKGENKKLIEDFLYLLPFHYEDEGIGTKDRKLYIDIENTLKRMDTLYKLYPRDLGNMNKDYEAFALRKGNKKIRAIGPWGPGPGAKYGSTDALADRHAAYVKGTEGRGDRSDLAFHQIKYNDIIGSQSIKLNKLLDDADLSDDDYYAIVDYLITEALLSRHFRNFFGGWLTRQVGLYDDIIDEAILPPMSEPTTYRDLMLPIYRDIFGAQNIPQINKRKDLIGRLQSFIILLPQIIGNNAIVKISENIRGKAPETFRDDMLAALDVIRTRADEDQNDRIRNLENGIKLLFDQESGRKGLQVPEEILPSYADLGLRVGGSISGSDKARTATDIVEPGWMYGHGYINSWGNLSKTMNAKDIVNDLRGDSHDITEYGTEEGDNVLHELSTETKLKKAAVKGGKPDDAKGLSEVVDKRIEERRKAKKSKSPRPTNKILGKPGPKKLSDNLIKLPDSKRLADKKVQCKAVGRPASVDQKLDSAEHANAIFRHDRDGKELSSMRHAYPSYAIYFLEEDAEDWGYLDDYYRYDAILSWDVVQAKDMPDTATIQFANYKGILSNTKTDVDISSNEVKSPESTVDESKPETADPSTGNRKSGQFGREDEYMVTSFRLRPGTRIVLKAGYTTKAEEMDTLFTGQVAEVVPGDITTVVCQSYVTQFLGHLNKEFWQGISGFPEILNLMMNDTTYFGRWELYVDRLQEQKRYYEGSLGMRFVNEIVRPFAGRNVGEIFPDTSDDNIYIRNEPENAFKWFWNWITGQEWIVNGEMWKNVLTMPRYVPNSVLAVRPYDGRATLFFGSPDQFYIHTNRFPGKPRFWKSKLTHDALNGLSDDYLGNHTMANSKNDISYEELIGRAVGRPAGGDSGDYFSDVDVRRYRSLFYANGLSSVMESKLKEMGDATLLALFGIWAKKYINMGYSSAEAILPTGGFYIIAKNAKVKVDRLYPKGRMVVIATPATGIFTEDIVGDVNHSTGVVHHVLLESHTNTIVPRGSRDSAFFRDDGGAAEAIRKFLIDDKLKQIIGHARDHGGIDEAVRTRISEVFGTGTLKNWRNPTAYLDAGDRWQERYLRIGFAVVMASTKPVYMYELQIEMSDNVVVDLLLNFLPMLYGIGDWSINNPRTLMADIYNLGENIAKPLHPPNERPFRESHVAISGYNIIKNNIQATMAHSATSVTMIADDPKSATTTMELAPSLLNKYHKLIKDDNAKKLFEQTQAVMSALGEEMRKMYRGQLSLLGNAKIKPYDYIRVDDHHNLMYGIVEADRVVHSFHGESGYTTTVVPHMVVKVQEDRGMDAAMWENFKCGAKSLGVTIGVTLGGQLAVGALLAPTAPFLIGGLLAFFGVGVLTEALLGMGTERAISDAKPFMFLGIPFPSFSTQGRFDSTRLNPVQIQPLVYRGEPYVVGLEGWDRSTWTLAETKKYKRIQMQRGREVIWRDIHEVWRAINESTGAAYDQAIATGEATWQAK